MKVFVNTVLLIINVASAALVAVFGICDEIMGAAYVERLLEKLHIPLSYNQALIIVYVCGVLMITTFILRKKLFGNL